MAIFLNIFPSFFYWRSYKFYFLIKTHSMFADVLGNKSLASFFGKWVFSNQEKFPATLNWAWPQNVPKLEVGKNRNRQFFVLWGFRLLWTLCFTSQRGRLIIDVMIELRFLFTGKYVETWPGKCFARRVICVRILFNAFREGLTYLRQLHVRACWYFEWKLDHV